MRDDGIGVLVAVFTAIGLFVGSLVGSCIVSDSWQARAVKDGKAEYYLDDNYNRQWRWKEIKR